MVIGRGHVLAKKWGVHGCPCRPYAAAPVGVGLNSTGDPDEASSCSELLFGAWARLEVGVGLQLTDLELV